MYRIRSPIGIKNKGHKRPAGEQAPTQDGRQTKAQRLHSPRQLKSTVGGTCRRAISATSPCSCNCRRDLRLLRPSARVACSLTRRCFFAAPPPSSVPTTGVGRFPPTPHSLHRLRMRWCAQMPPPPHSLHLLLSRWCGQMLEPPHSLHQLLWH